jgi:PKD repeat protein
MWQTNYGDAGEYYVTLTATDDQLTTTQEILLVVNRVNVNPEIEDLMDLEFDEGDIIEFSPEVSDPNNDAVAVTITEPLASGMFATDHTSAGSYEIFVTASDGELDTETSFMLTINDVNELPTITDVEDITISEGETVTIEPMVSDLDGDELTITISEPVGDAGVWETEFIDHGEYEIKITVDDGKDTVSQTITLTVEDVNMPPQIVDISLDVE